MYSLNPGFDEGDFTSGNPIGWVNSATIANPTNPSNGVDDLFYQGCGGGNCFDFTFQQPGYVSQQLNGTDASTCYVSCSHRLVFGLFGLPFSPLDTQYISFYGANEAYPQDQQLTTSVYSPTTLDVTFGTYVMPIDLTGVATLTDPSLNIPGETTRNNQFSQFSIYARGAGPTTELTFTCSPYYYFDIDTVSVTAIDSSATGECGASPAILHSVLSHWTDRARPDEHGRAERSLASHETQGSPPAMVNALTAPPSLTVVTLYPSHLGLRQAGNLHTSAHSGRISLCPAGCVLLR